MKKSMFDKIKDIPACHIVAMDEVKLHSLEKSFISEAKWLLSRKTKLEKEISQNVLGTKWIRGAIRAKKIKGAQNG